MLTTALKQKSCKHCKTRFMPTKTFQVVCGPMCGLERARIKREADAEKVKAVEAKEHRQKLAKSRETIPKLIAAAQVAFNAFIRERDKDKGCFVCGRPFLDGVDGRIQHAGHVRSRGAAGHLRFDEDNCLGECEGCNGPNGAKPHQIKAGAIARIGQEKFDTLEADNTPIKWERDVLRQITTIYRAKARQLLKERG